MDLTKIERQMQAQDWAGAAAACVDGLRAMPTNPKLHAYLGLCLFHSQRFEEAEQSFQRATTLDPQFWQAGVKHAQTLDRLGKYEEAYDVAKCWQRLAPNDRTLSALLMGLEMRGLDHGPKQGWERTRHLETRAVLAEEA